MLPLLPCLSRQVAVRTFSERVVVTISNGSQSAFFILYNMLAGSMPDGSHKSIHLPLAPEYIGYGDIGLEQNFFTATRPEIELLDGNLFKYPAAVQDGVWTRILSGVRPPAPELLPDISVYPHNPLLDWRPKKVTPDTSSAFRSRTKEATTDDVLFKIQDKPLSKIMRLVMPAFEMISLPDLADQYENGLPQEIQAELTAQKRLLKCFAMYTLALHSDIT